MRSWSNSPRNRNSQLRAWNQVQVPTLEQRSGSEKSLGRRDLPKIALAAAVCLVVTGGPASARDDVHHITCEMVRAYVAQMGVVQAKAIALAHGMTASQEQRARRCLGS
jgi:hypothetical protein